jgi:hypothetical protein
MTLNEFLALPHAGVRNHIVCKDGFRLSVQASVTHYCRPRVDNAPRYEYVEVANRGDVIDALASYLEGLTDLKVYPYVPVALVESVILQHGGIA